MAQDASSQRWLSAARAVAGAGLTGAAAVVENDNAWGVWAVAVVLAAQGVFGFRWWTVRLRVAQRLAAELGSRARRSPAAG